MKQRFALLALLLLISFSALADGQQNDWRITAGLAPNFMQFDLIKDNLESDIGFSIWGDYYFSRHWFAHFGYDHFEFKGPPTMDTFMGGPGYEFDTWEERWFPYINLGAGIAATQNFQGDIASETAFAVSLRPGIEYAVSDSWFLGVSIDYIHMFASDTPGGYDVALPFISLTYSLNRLATRQREDSEPQARLARPKTKDTDQDGVRNEYDACPNTPRGVVVDEVGCPAEEDDMVTDTDRDTVVDFYDQCPNTPRGAKVNGFGCQVQEKIQMRLTVNFAWDSDVIEAQYYKNLNKVAKLMKKNPKAKLLIEGHTDSTGSLKYNMKLSRRRAGAIRTFLVDGGLVESQRVSSEGYGPTRPVKTNKTEAGRAENRRILATFFY